MVRAKLNPDEYNLRVEVAKKELSVLFEQFVKLPNAPQFRRLEKSMLEYQTLMCNTDADIDVIAWTEDES